MKAILCLFTVISLFSPSVFGICDEEVMIKNVEEYSYRIHNGYGTRFESLSFHGILAPGEEKKVSVAMDDFTWQNPSSEKLILLTLFGRNLIGASFWVAWLELGNCKVVEAHEILGEGGAGL